MRLIINAEKKLAEEDWEKIELEVSIDDCECICLKIIGGVDIRISKVTLDWALKTFIERCEIDEST